MKIALIAGARPNYIKIYPLLKALKFQSQFVPLLIDTRQHYDESMNKIFFRDLELPEPDVFLETGSGTHGQQVGRIMIDLESVLKNTKPDLVLVFGDVNSTMAAAITAVKIGIRVAHVESGLRSFDRTMPEEINRVLTDAVSDVLFTSCRDADANLQREGLPVDKIHFVGNIMIDTLNDFLPKANESKILSEWNLSKKRYAVVTLHRPSVVDDPDALKRILESLNHEARKRTIVFPVHPRTRKRIDHFGLAGLTKSLILTNPLGYLDFLCLMSNSQIVITDSGGIQEETTYLGIPCLTLRPNTERPITIDQGTNRLVDIRKEGLSAAIESGIFRSLKAAAPVIEKWDGQTADRILDVLSKMDLRHPSSL
jgi:UDP-N-acetylglucosamine 2-epimerase (non-hydrolysing)